MYKINRKIIKKNGLAEIPLILGIVIMIIAIPAAIKLTQQSQDTRSSAAYVTTAVVTSTPTGTGAVAPVISSISTSTMEVYLAGRTVTVSASCVSGNCMYMDLWVNGSEINSPIFGNNYSYDYTFPQESTAGNSFSFVIKGCSKDADSSGSCPTGNLGQSNLKALFIGEAGVKLVSFSVKNITEKQAEITGFYSSMSNVSSYWIEYGNDASDLSTMSTITSTNDKSGTIDIILNDLLEGKDYYYRAVAQTSDSQVGYSDIGTFQTVASLTPTPTLILTPIPTTVITGCGICPVDTIMAGQTRLTGDSSCNGVVDISDRGIIVDEIKNSLVVYGDLSCDGATNILDYGLWMDMFLSNH